MELKSLYREILNEHNINPAHKAEMQNPSITLQGVNPSCGDNITLYLKTEDGKITDGSFTGTGCAISQASVDMMLDLIIGQDETEALRLARNFMAMIKGEATEEQIEELTEISEDMAELNEENLEELSDEALAEADAAVIAQVKEQNNMLVDKTLPEKYRHIDYHI